MKSLTKAAWGAAIILGLAGCAGEQAHRDGLNQIAEGRFDEGLANLERASKEAPDNVAFRADYLRRKEDQINRLLAAADTDRIGGAFDSSEGYYRRVLQMEPANNRAQAGIDALEKERRYAPIIDLAKETLAKGEVDRAAALLKPLFAEGSTNIELAGLKRQIDELEHKKTVVEPVLKTSQKKPISLEFRDANLRIVFEALARSSGVNFILDQDVKPDLRTTIFLRDSSLENAIDLLLQTNRLEKKVLNSNTILIYPNTPEKLKDYQELVVKGFYLGNADAKQTQAMIKGLLKTKDVFIDEKLNLIVMRDTPEAIKLAEKLIAMHDLADPEVMLEVEVLEVKRTKLTELGIQWPTKLTLSPLSSSGSTSTTLMDLKNLNSDRVGANLSSAVVNLRREVGDANILANPRIRARNREKAKIMIGDKVPVSTTTTTATGIISESIQYLDVGIKLEVEPNVYLQDEVAIKVGLEVSSITNQVLTPAGSVTYQIGSRSASTVLRLRDGETQVLAGLIGDEDRMSANRVPGLGDIPILGRLFASQKDDRQKTEIVLSITPHLIRNIKRPEAAFNEFWSGTEMALRNRPLTLQPLAMDDEVKSGKTPTADAPNSGAAKAKNTSPSHIALQWQGPKQAKVGEQFKLALRVKSDGGLRSLPFQLGFDPAALQVVEIAEGPFFKQDGGQSSISSNVDAKSGKAFVSVVRSGVEGVQGDDAIAVLTFRVLDAKGPTEVKVVSATPVSVGDANAAPVLPPPFVLQPSN
ncbi:cohesin domain-containing protein [Herbaspirillum sp. RV1423]|uniref:cohesin domain-containing protein n=1 Tax=Herbaspirillum sp. RV1423 TaxID=1443993 RepID=UPI0004B6B22C|nr:cohesin domain-containing protein [Herbaspirillum sp. RV1423]